MTISPHPYPTPLKKRGKKQCNDAVLAVYRFPLQRKIRYETISYSEQEFLHCTDNIFILNHPIDPVGVYIGQCLIFIMGSPILVWQHLYTESPPWPVSVSTSHHRTSQSPCANSEEGPSNGKCEENGMATLLAFTGWIPPFISKRHNMRVMAFQISKILAVCSTACSQTTNKENTETPQYSPLEREIQQWPQGLTYAKYICLPDLQNFHFSNMIYQIILQKSTCPSGQAMGYVLGWGLLSQFSPFR